MTDADIETAADTETSAQCGAAARFDGALIRRRRSWIRLLGYGLLPVAVVALATTIGVSTYRVGQSRQYDLAQVQSVQTASEATVSMLSYNADNVDKVLTAVQDRLTGPFRDSYAALISQVVIPGVKQKKVSANATVPSAASVSATPSHAVVMVYVNQAIIVGTDAPTATASTIQVTLDKVRNRWLVSAFDPK